jgi:ABC-type transport system involved in cytochrome c biogenesis ATPase subunit
MKIKSIKIEGFRRFSSLSIEGLPMTAKLVVIVGPNGCGKSSLFDALLLWTKMKGAVGVSWDRVYYLKKGVEEISPESVHGIPGGLVDLDFWRPTPIDQLIIRSLINIRTAYRNEPDFQMQTITKQHEIKSLERRNRLCDNDLSVSENYQKLALMGLEGVWSTALPNTTVGELREQYFGTLRESITRIFPSLHLDDLGNPITVGAFRFSKGTSSGFHYKNLSSGEKACFDLLLDLAINSLEKPYKIFCIDEPEAHVGVHAQAKLLQEMCRLVSDDGQLWIATHSVEMLRQAKQMEQDNPGSVAFLDFDRDFDVPQVISPSLVDKKFWAKAVKHALDDFASFMSSEQIVFCEGGNGGATDSESDAKCYNTIFSSGLPTTTFFSVGSYSEVTKANASHEKIVKAISPNTKILRLIDRDDRNNSEVEELIKRGVRVLSRRNLEAYLFAEDVLSKLCESIGSPDKLQEILAARKALINDLSAREKSVDDIKAISGELYLKCKGILGLKQCGNNARAFMEGTLAGLLAPGSPSYEQLLLDLCGDKK